MTERNLVRMFNFIPSAIQFTCKLRYVSKCCMYIEHLCLNYMLFKRFDWASFRKLKGRKRKSLPKFKAFKLYFSPWSQQTQFEGKLWYTIQKRSFECSNGE